MKRLIPLIALAASPAMAQSDPLAPCAACHNASPDAQGPTLDGILGRPAASLPDFRYSGPLRRSGIVWTAQNLRAFIIDPQSLVPGTRMPFAGATPEEAARILAALQSRSR